MGGKGVLFLFGEKVPIWIALSLWMSPDPMDVSGVCETDVCPDQREGTEAVPGPFLNRGCFGDFRRDRTELRRTVLGGVDGSAPASFSYAVGGVITDEYPVFVDDILGRGGWSSALRLLAWGTAGEEEK